jgi:hypothetical protein
MLRAQYFTGRWCEESTNSQTSLTGTTASYQVTPVLLDFHQM